MEQDNLTAPHQEDRLAFLSQIDQIYSAGMTLSAALTMNRITQVEYDNLVPYLSEYKDSAECES